MAPGRIAALLAPTPADSDIRPAVLIPVGLGGAAGRSWARSGAIVGQRLSMVMPALTDPFAVGSAPGERWLDGFDGAGSHGHLDAEAPALFALRTAFRSFGAGGVQSDGLVHATPGGGRAEARPGRQSSTTVSWSANWSTTCRTTPTSPAGSRETNRHSCLLAKRPGPGSAGNRPRFDIMVSEHD
jgi:hypothetical protein